MNGRALRPTTVLAALLLLLVGWLASQPSQGPQYPYLEVGSTAGLAITMLLPAEPTAAACQSRLLGQADALRAVCMDCRLTSQRCLLELTEDLRDLHGEAPLPAYSLRSASGDLRYQADDARQAARACADNQSQAQTAGQWANCHAPGEARPRAPLLVDTDYALNLVLAAFGAASLCSWLIIRFEHLHAHLSHDQVGSGPQKFHALATPRIGGVALVAGLLTSSGLLLQQNWLPEPATLRALGLLLIASLPAFMAGLTEDLTKRVGAQERLLLTLLSGALGAWLLNACLTRTGLPVLDTLLAWTPLAVAFTAVAVGGVSNALNIIDGYNGLAAGFAAIALVALAYVAYQVGDSLVLTAALLMLGALLGFLIWNWPGGAIFLGDGGAYLVGFWLAELSVLLVVRNPAVSPWFPVLLLAYPVFETLYSIYRKKLQRGGKASRPDGLHFHMLIYRRLVRLHIGSRDPQRQLQRNSRVALYVWAGELLGAVVACLYWQASVPLVMALVLGCLLYLWVYVRTIRWGAIPWLVWR